MTNGDPSSTETLPSEADLSTELGISREILKGLRAQSLTSGDDYGKVHGRGIVYTPSGLQKIKAALQPMLEAGPQKNEAPPPPPPPDPPETVTLIVSQRSGNNGLSCLCIVEGSQPPRRAFVRVPGARQKASTLQRGMRLTGCMQAFPGNSEVFDYDGPVPTRFGQPLPEKKEVRP